MSIRRPRIKASANLMNVKRKIKHPVETNHENSVDNQDNRKLANNKFGGAIDDSQQTNISLCEKISEEKHPELHGTNGTGQSNAKTAQWANASNISETVQHMTFANESNVFGMSTNDTNSFKCPPKLENNYISASNVDDVFHSELDSDVIQTDLLKSKNMYPMSPTKAQSRQRIRPTPVFGQRRNSFVGTSPSPHTSEENAYCVELTNAPQTQRRERLLSATSTQTSAVQYYHNPHKIPMMIGDDALVGERMRTQSMCSALSESNVACKVRKSEDNVNNRSRRDFEARFTNGVPDKSTIKMFDLIYYNPATNPMEQTANTSFEKLLKLPNDSVTQKGEEGKLERNKTSEHDNSAIAVPQLKLNAKGELILDDKSLEIETTAEQEARKVLANSSLIYLDENTGMNGFYKRQKRTKEWPPEETIKFYRCLQTVGTDFSLMCQLFPNRNRRDLKLKFKKEERCNVQLINKALLYPNIFNITELKEQLEVEQKEEAAEHKWKAIKSKEAKHTKKSTIQTSVAARNLTYGDDIYRNENVVEHKLSSIIAASRELKNNASDLSPGKKTTRRQPQQHVIPKVDKSPIKMKAIKTEKLCSQTGLFQKSAAINSIDCTDTTQIEKDLTDLLCTDNLECSQLCDQTLMDQLYNENLNSTLTINAPRAIIEHDTLADRTFDNIDDATVTFAGHISASASYLTRTLPIPVGSEHELCESDIQKILTDLAEGSLVLVSTLYPEKPDKVMNEIYMMDKQTGELLNKPLDIPEVIVQGILSVIT